MILEVFYNTLKKLENHDDVDNVQVVICDVDEGSWPYTELIYVNTKLDIEQVTQMVAHLEPDDIWHAEDLEQYIPLQDCYKLLAIWWD